MNVLIASPGDLQVERERIPRIFAKWNSANEGVHLSPIMWETGSVPELGGHPQHSLDRQLIPKSDILIAMFWSKIGTPTPTAPSGTIEEIREFIAQKGSRRVMLYFCDRPVNESPATIDTTAIALLQEFKAEMRDKGLYSTFHSSDQFEGTLYYDLDIKIGDFLQGKLPVPAATDTEESGLPQQEAWCRPDHPDERLREPVHFGDSFVDIADGFKVRMVEFDMVDGSTKDKYQDFGAHIFYSAAHSLDELMTQSPYAIPSMSRNALRSIVTQLRELAGNSRTYTGGKWKTFWDEGRAISDELYAIADRSRTNTPL